jgi:hypothetical protein
VVVKIDNLDAARPQSGIGQADIVYEELVEGGLTRLAAIFQSSYPTVVGPVRSGRLTDEYIADDLNHPVYAYSGTNADFLPILRAQPLTDVDDDNQPGAFYRNPSREAPHNLYSDVVTLAGLSTTKTSPPPLFRYVLPGHSFGGPGASAATHISIPFPSAAITWDYSPATHVWMRGQNGTADVDASGVQIHAANVVVLFVNYITSGIASGEGGPPTPIPEGVLTGTGQAWFLSGGKIVKGTWSRSGLTTPATYANLSGGLMRITRGQTWIELVPIGDTPSVIP